MNRDMNHFRVSSPIKMLKNNVLADCAADAAAGYFRKTLHRRDIVVVRSEGDGTGPGHYSAYERKGSELVAIRKVESVRVVPTSTRPF